MSRQLSDTHALIPIIQLLLSRVLVYWSPPVLR